jgi:hypothetical protein
MHILEKKRSVGSGASIIAEDDYWAEQLSDNEYTYAKNEFEEQGLVKQKNT